MMNSEARKRMEEKSTVLVSVPLDYDLAVAEIKKHDDRIYALDPWDPEVDEDGNHCFTWGWAEYSRWELLRSEAWVWVLKPIVEDGKLVRYELVESEKVD